MTLVFLLEELSMKAFLEGLLPHVLPPGTTYKLIPHEGKSDLEQSTPRKLRAWKTPGTQFVVVRDQDSANCKAIKAKLVALCRKGRRPDTLVRIACRELESWFLGDLEAVETALGVSKLGLKQNKAKYRTPDALGNPSEELTKLAPNYQKVGGARAIGQHLSPKRCRSHSFRVFLSGVRGLLGPAAS